MLETGPHLMRATPARSAAAGRAACLTSAGCFTTSLHGSRASHAVPVRNALDTAGPAWRRRAAPRALQLQVAREQHLAPGALVRKKAQLRGQLVRARDRVQAVRLAAGCVRVQQQHVRRRQAALRAAARFQTSGLSAAYATTQSSYRDAPLCCGAACPLITPRHDVVTFT